MAGKGKIEPRWKKGESGNPAGRPKGSRNRSTIVKEWLEVKEKVKNPITGQTEELEQQDIMTLALINKARKGDVYAYKELMDSAYDKVRQSVDHTTNGKDINIPIIAWDKTDGSQD